MASNNAGSLPAALPTVAELDLSWLAEPVSAERPAGEALDEEVFALLQRAAPQTSMVEGHVEASSWPSICGDAVLLLSRSRHLELGVLLTQALLNIHGWSGFYVGVRAIEVLLEKHWPSLYPELTNSGEAYRRVNVLASLASPEMLHDLRAAPVLASLRFQSLLDDGTKESDLRQAFLAATPGERSAPSAVLTTLQTIQTLMTQRSASLGDLDPLLVLVEQASAKVRTLTLKFGESVPIEGLSLAVEGAVSSSEPAPRDRELGAIHNTREVLLALDRICEYYEKYERSSPVPLLLVRAKHLVDRSFLEAVQDLADKGLPQVQLIIGAQDGAKSDS